MLAGYQGCCCASGGGGGARTGAGQRAGGVRLRPAVEKDACDHGAARRNVDAGAGGHHGTRWRRARVRRGGCVQAERVFAPDAGGPTGQMPGLVPEKGLLTHEYGFRGTVHVLRMWREPQRLCRCVRQLGLRRTRPDFLILYRQLQHVRDAGARVVLHALHHVCRCAGHVHQLQEEPGPRAEDRGLDGVHRDHRVLRRVRRWDLVRVELADLLAGDGGAVRDRFVLPAATHVAR